MKGRPRYVLLAYLAACCLPALVRPGAAGVVNFPVNTTDDNDDGSCDPSHCSLREAINTANARAGDDIIGFAIPGSDPGCDAAGVCTIQLTQALPPLIDGGTVIDAYTQPGASPNTNPFGDPINAVPKIVLDGVLLPSCCPHGLDIRGANNTISGLVIQRFDTGIEVFDASGNRIEGNFVGTSADGTTARGNRCSGISISGFPSGGSSYNIVGGDTPAARNLISGNKCSGIEIGPVGNNRIQGNYIGTDASGLSPIPNDRSGARVFNVSQGNRIGGANQGEANLIAFNSGAGVEIDSLGGNAAQNTISRNRIHTNFAKGISLLNGGNGNLPPPVITAVNGFQALGTACANCTVEVFSDTADEGGIYEGTTTADGAGNWTLAKASPLSGPQITATATDPDGNTSEFSAPVERLIEPGDGNCDGVVSAADLTALVRLVGTGVAAGNAPPPCGGDADGSGTIDAGDLRAIIGEMFS